MYLRRQIAKQAQKVATQIPYTHFVDRHILSTKEGALVGFIQLEPVDGACVDQASILMQQQAFKRAIAQLPDGVTCWAQMYRDLESVQLPEQRGEHFAAQFRYDYLKQFHVTPPYEDKFLVTVILPAAVGKLPKGSLWRGIQHQDIVSTQRQKQMEQMKQVLGQLLATLGEHQARLLDIYAQQGGYVSEALRYLSFIINGQYEDRYLTLADVSSGIGQCELYFGGDTLQWQGATPGEKQFGALLSIRQYTQSTWPKMLEVLYRLRVRFLVTNSFTKMSTQACLSEIKKQKNRLKQVHDPAQSQLEALDGASDLVQSDKMCFGTHHHTLMLMAESRDALEQVIQEAMSIYGSLGFKLVRETLNLESAFWAQLPGNQKEITRSAMISSDNLCDLFCLHHPTRGHYDQGYLGGALMPVRQNAEGLCWFNLHEPGGKTAPNLGMTTIIGPSRSGKTAMMCAIDAMSQQYGGRRFFFDRQKSFQAYILAQQGHYITFEPGISTEINPIPAEDTPESRNFLYHFLEGLLCPEHTALTAADRHELSMVVDGIYALPKSKRCLRQVKDFLSVGWAYRDNLDLWLYESQGPYAALFDHEVDGLNLESSLIGFDCTYLLAHPKTLLPMMQVLMHRIEANMDGSLCGIYLDEGWQFLNHAYWCDTIATWLNSFAKLNTYVVFATQQPKHIIDSPVHAELISGVATQIFLADPNPDERIYLDHFHVTSQELSAIKQLHHQPGQFLFKQKGCSTCATLPLEQLQNYLSIFSLSARSVHLLDSLFNEHGELPENWVTLFQSKCETLTNATS